MKLKNKRIASKLVNARKNRLMLANHVAIDCDNSAVKRVDASEADILDVMRHLESHASQKQLAKASGFSVCRKPLLKEA